MLFSSAEIPRETVKTVNSLSRRQRLPQSVLLSGGSEALRRKCALELAMAVNCTDLKDGQPCMKCPACVKIKAGSHPDVRIIVPEKDRKNVSKEVVKEQVMENLHVAPNEAFNNIFIFPEADELSPIIQNMLLKTIEEPPEFDMFIFECGQREGMLETVLSRCTEFPLGDVLASKSKKEDEKCAAAACGIIDALCGGNEFDIMLACSPMVKNRAMMKKTAAKIITVVRDAMAESSGTPLLSGCEKQAVALSVHFSTAQLLKIKSSMDEIITFAEQNANENLLISKFSSMLAQI